MEWRRGQIQRKRAAGPASASRPSGDCDGEVPMDRNSPHVLVVEDDQQMRKMIMEHFRDNNLDAIGAGGDRKRRVTWPRKA